MLNKIISLSGTIALYLFASLFLATVILGLVLKYAWNVDRTKMMQMLAIAQGADLYNSEAKMREAVEERIASMTFEEVLAKRTERDLDRDFATTGSGSMGDTVMHEIRTIEDKMKSQQAVHANFERRLKQVRDDAQSLGIREVTQMIERLEPDLGKRHIKEMIDKGQYARVIAILRGMQITPRSDLLNEMTQDEEVKNLAVIFQKLADGDPEEAVVQEAEEEMKKLNGGQ